MSENNQEVQADDLIVPYSANCGLLKADSV